MQRIWQFLTHTNTLAVIGFAALAGFLFLGASAMQLAAIWAAGLLVLAVVVWLAYRL